MKKVLFGTTALVAAAFAGQAMANDVKLSIVGDVLAGVGVGEATGQTLTGTDVSKDFHIVNDGEIQFKAKGTLDNGITVEVRFELEGYSTDDNMDENWVKVSSSFGSILIGNNDTALDNVAGGIGRMGGGVSGGAWDSDYEFVVGTQSQHLGDYSDNMAIHYYTPNIAGFEIGVSWAPSTSSDDAYIDTDLDTTNSNDGISIGAAYANSFGDVDFAIGGGYYTEDNDDEETFAAYGGGIELGFGGFTLGGAVELRDFDAGFGSEGSRQGASTEDGELLIYSVGLEYGTGPWSFGVSGMISEYETDDAGVDEYETLRINGAVGYELGDGVSIGATIDYGDYDEDGDDDDQDGFGGALLLGVSF